jgi:hypothetical protein
MALVDVLIAEVFVKKGDRVVCLRNAGEYMSAVCKLEAPKFVKLGKTFVLEPEVFEEYSWSKTCFLIKSNNRLAYSSTKPEGHYRNSACWGTLFSLTKTFWNSLKLKVLSMIDKIDKYLVRATVFQKSLV